MVIALGGCIFEVILTEFHANRVDKIKQFVFVPFGSLKLLAAPAPEIVSKGKDCKMGGGGATRSMISYRFYLIL
jgi:hypothetical protein